ncbi:MAG TPA: glycosyltransferase [Solirubrobacteraceae bacterium]|jgi:dolichol-phosphate mannosyltransferase
MGCDACLVSLHERLTMSLRSIIMDCDLQDPPEVVPDLYAKAREGYDVVLARRRRRRQPLIRRTASHAYHNLRNLLVKDDMYTNYTNLSIVSRKVVDAFLCCATAIASTC